MGETVSAGTSASLSSALGLEVDRCVCWVGSAHRAEPAVRIACELACAGRCQVVLSLDSPNRLGADVDPAFSGRGPLTPQVIRTAEIRLRELYGPEPRTVVLPGHPIRELRRYARINAIDLIVKGDQALAIEREYGERLVDDAPCAVLSLVKPAPTVEES
jgi:nucleotide-binding universal stress UspA family protein